MELLSEGRIRTDWYERVLIHVLHIVSSKLVMRCRCLNARSGIDVACYDEVLTYPQR